MCTPAIGSIMEHENDKEKKSDPFSPFTECRKVLSENLLPPHFQRNFHPIFWTKKILLKLWITKCCRLEIMLQFGTTISFVELLPPIASMGMEITMESKTSCRCWLYLYCMVKTNSHHAFPNVRTWSPNCKFDASDCIQKGEHIVRPIRVENSGFATHAEQLSS